MRSPARSLFFTGNQPKTMYTKHQQIAAEIAEGSIETPLSAEDILTVAATEIPGKIWDVEHSMSFEELAQYYVEECKKIKPRWKYILRG